eukprot:9242454-Pyramimonas_sp.AAC.1
MPARHLSPRPQLLVYVLQPGSILQSLVRADVGHLLAGELRAPPALIPVPPDLAHHRLGDVGLDGRHEVVRGVAAHHPARYPRLEIGDQRGRQHGQQHQLLPRARVQFEDVVVERHRRQRPEHLVQQAHSGPPKAHDMHPAGHRPPEQGDRGARHEAARRNARG